MKKILFLGAIMSVCLMLLMIAGCIPQTSICGDGICSVEEEMRKMCPQDCEEPEGFIIKENFGRLMFEVEEADPGCELLRQGDCVVHTGRYNYYDQGLDQALVAVENHKQRFSNRDAIKAIFEEFYNDELINVEDDPWDGKNNVYIFLYEESSTGTSNVAIVWYSGKNIIAILFDNFNDDELEEELELEKFIQAYMDKYPSSLIFEPMCEDTDGGFDIYQKGAAGFTTGSNEMVDHCDGNVLYEGYCPGIFETPAYTEYFCGFGCKDGRCIMSSALGGFEDYPTQFFDNNQLDVQIVVGVNAPISDVIAAIDIAASLQKFPTINTNNLIGTAQEIIKTEPIPVGLAVLDINAKDPMMYNTISVGIPCYNSVSAKLLGNPDDCYKGFEPGKGKLLMYHFGGKTQILVAGYGEQDTRGTARVLADYEDYSLSGECAEVIVADLNTIIVNNCVNGGGGGGYI
ncbi:MAG: hypothetical protein KKF46_08555 [Nanoarchaeota archaeon]|nr:hypothetical protein [Nanoarchaeota archaeon]MBU1322380.1 hypothetical protein [Nanoarchaeota archaeon]MBU1598407.1 hypothetical protein [Nanoarchaeota archaeon]MBU2440784.1 hypothetical protein [Nanoarchaeota archaeon]